MTSFNEFMDELRWEAEAEGPEALAEFEALEKIWRSPDSPLGESHELAAARRRARRQEEGAKQPRLTLAEAAAELEVSRRFVEELAAAHELELFGDDEYVSRASVERYLKHRREAESRPLPFDDRVRVSCTSYCNRYCVGRCILSTDEERSE